ncbi:MAG TPA: hypothetical protein IGS17_04030 [Oscillatoriales cyanobacterium M59_W2019_021]|nr:hypothetical protein [Oscillatoriales cyanobacterium M4454_W2019_049]HIK50085.1 hypothetical protein [Oscillatoriales cyanobacterium M59_W2019_021]
MPGESANPDRINLNCSQFTAAQTNYRSVEKVFGSAVWVMAASPRLRG